jgi:hypothetical protein
MKIYGVWKYGSSILDLVSRWRWVFGFTPRQLYPRERYTCTHCVGGWWVPQPVWTLCSREKSLAPAGNRTPAIQPVTRRYADWAILPARKFYTVLDKGQDTDKMLKRERHTTTATSVVYGDMWYMANCCIRWSIWSHVLVTNDGVRTGNSIY